MIVIGLSCMFYYWCCPMVLSVSRKREGLPLSGLQYVHHLLMVGGVSVTEAHTRVSRLFAYGIKRT